MSERVYRCTTDVEKWYEVIDSVFAYLMTRWMTKVGVANYGNDDEWIDVGGRSTCVTLHVYEWLHICRNSMHIASKLGMCMFSVVTGYVTVVMTAIGGAEE